MGIKIFFGVPGSGKTTLAAKFVHDNLKRGIKTFSNVPIKGALLFDTSDLGVYDISDGCMVLDEAGIAFNNRKFKSLSQCTIEWLKLHRHYGIRDIYVFSQSYDDMDITLRRLADEIYVVKRSLIPFLFSTKRIKVKVGIDKDTHQIMDQYFFQFLGVKSYFGFHYWHMFDSWSAPDLPSVRWHYSSFDSFTINKKHSKLIYKKLHREGKLYYKLFLFFNRLFSRKNYSAKEHEKKQFLGLSRMLNYLPSFMCSGARARASCEGQPVAPATDSAAPPAQPDVDAAFLAFFAQSPACAAEAEEASALEKKEKKKRRNPALFRKLRNVE